MIDSHIKINRAAMRHFDSFTPKPIRPEAAIRIVNIGGEWVYELTIEQARMLAGKAHDRRK